jgi:hypothetical protein
VSTCLTYLLFDFAAAGPAPQDSFAQRLKEHPFLHYAATQLAYHIASGTTNHVDPHLVRFLTNRPKLACALQVLFLEDENFPRPIYYYDSSDLGPPPMCVAAYFGLQKVIEIPGCKDISATCGIGRQPIHYAARGGQADMITFLAAQGSNVNAQDKYGFTPLHLASEIGQCGAVQALLDAGASSDLTTYRERSTPLHWAAKWGHLETARALVDGGASVERRDLNGYTPLFLASYYDREPVIDYLTKDGPDTGGLDNQSKNPLIVKCDVWKV